MRHFNRRTSLLTVVIALGIFVPTAAFAEGSGAGFGRLSGSVTDGQGNPLMGASVRVMGPLWGIGSRARLAVERVITDAHGEFALERLIPGRYSIRVTAPTRLPAVRNGINVEAGEASRQKFVLSDILAPMRLQVPSSKVSNWGDDWKWVLRTSSTTRPILRYQEVAKTQAPAGEPLKRFSPVTRRLIGMMPGSDRREALGGDPGVGSVLAYMRQLSEDSDVLVAGSMSAMGLLESSLGTSFRKHMAKGDPQELSLVVHHLSLFDASPLTREAGRDGLVHTPGITINYSHTRRLSDSLSVTAGLELDYLNAARDVLTASPRMKLDYRLNPSTSIDVRYGSVRLDDGASSMADRVGMLSAFPRVTMRGFRPRLEQLSHAEVSVHRNLTRSSRVEIAGYRDSIQNAVVRGLGMPGTSAWLAGNLSPNPGAEGVFLNAGDYTSSGFRATYSVGMGKHMEAAFAYALGRALTVETGRLTSDDSQRNLQSLLRVHPSRSVTGKVSSRVPYSNTQITTSYQWLERGRVTGVDPYGDADLELQPFLGVQIRQPLPAFGFLPARIEALADFRNLLGEGYVPLYSSGGKPFILTSSYRSLRGGFSLQF